MGRTEVTIAGLGGQGSILAGVILGSAAVTHDARYAVQTQAYSSELRGGFAAAWVVIDENPILFPRVTRPDILAAQAPDAVSRFLKTLKPDGVLLVDSDMVRDIPAHEGEVYGVPATSIARLELQAPLTANMVMLGALCRVCGPVSRQSLEQAIREAVPPGKAEINLKAFERGYQSVAALPGNPADPPAGPGSSAEPELLPELPLPAPSERHLQP